MNPLGALLLLCILAPLIALGIGWALTPVCICGNTMEEVETDIADTNKYYCRECRNIKYR